MVILIQSDGRLVSVDPASVYLIRPGNDGGCQVFVARGELCDMIDCKRDVAQVTHTINQAL